MAESEDELKSLLMKVKVESEKVGLKLNNQKTKIMVSSPISSWEIDGETEELPGKVASERSMGPIYTPPVSSSASCSSSAATAGEEPCGSPQPMVSQPQA